MAARPVLTLLVHEYAGRPIIMANYKERVFWTVTYEDQRAVIDDKTLPRFEGAPSFTKHPFSDLPPAVQEIFS